MQKTTPFIIQLETEIKKKIDDSMLGSSCEQMGEQRGSTHV